MAFFSVCRLCDSAGDPTDRGFVVIAAGSSSDVVCSTVRTVATNQVYGTYAMVGLGFIPGTRGNTSLQNGNTRAFPAFGYGPEMLPIIGLSLVVATEFSFGATFAVALVGSTNRTYLTLRQAVQSNSVGLAMIWE